MHTDNMKPWTHEHLFNQDQRKAGEKRTLLIVAITAVMMVVEIVAGLVFGSMALLADGLHMASHATALGIAVLAYVISRRLAADARFSFGVGKINSLAGFASAVMLLGFALSMAVESTSRLFNPLQIAFEQALVVAFLGLLVNGFSAWVLSSTPHEHGHANGHVHNEDPADAIGHNHGQVAHHDHNLKAAYLHVMADAVTSLLAIAALLAGKYLGVGWLDPIMGIVGAVLVTRWSFGLLRQTSWVLLDYQGNQQHLQTLRYSLERGTEDRVSDLHLWEIGHGIHAAEITLVSHEPQAPDYYKAKIPAVLNIVHTTIEVHCCEDRAEAA